MVEKSNLWLRLLNNCAKEYGLLTAYFTGQDGERQVMVYPRRADSGWYIEVTSEPEGFSVTRYAREEGKWKVLEEWTRSTIEEVGSDLGALFKAKGFGPSDRIVIS